MDWIISHPTVVVDANKTYIVLCIAQRTGNPSYYLYNPQLMLGWEFKRLLEGCYAAIPMPEWKGMN